MSFQYAPQETNGNPAPRHGGNSFGDRLYFISAKDFSGFMAYYFVLANPLRIPQFNQMLKSGQTFDLKIYSSIIASGYGVPSESVKEQMRTKYGWKG